MLMSGGQTIFLGKTDLSMAFRMLLLLAHTQSKRSYGWKDKILYYLLGPVSAVLTTKNSLIPKVHTTAQNRYKRESNNQLPR